MNVLEDDEMMDGVPSEFSMILGTLPSMTATAELVVPRSIPMMGPLTLSPSSAYPLRNCDVSGARYADDLKVVDDVREAA